jgi:hypothetical protein
MVILSSNGIIFNRQEILLLLGVKVRQITKTLEQFELRWIVTKDIVILLAKNEKEEENM